MRSPWSKLQSEVPRINQVILHKKSLIKENLSSQVSQKSRKGKKSRLFIYSFKLSNPNLSGNGMVDKSNNKKQHKGVKQMEIKKQVKAKQQTVIADLPVAFVSLNEKEMSAIQGGRGGNQSFIEFEDVSVDLNNEFDVVVVI
jgi:hypothetical protein